MKSLLIVSLLFGSLSVFADHHKEWENMPFAEKKTKISEKLDKRMKQLQENKSCVDNAKDDAALKVCTKQMKEQGKAMKEKWKKMKNKKEKKD